MYIYVYLYLYIYMIYVCIYIYIYISYIYIYIYIIIHYFVVYARRERVLVRFLRQENINSEAPIRFSGGAEAASGQEVRQNIRHSLRGVGGGTGIGV